LELLQQTSRLSGVLLLLVWAQVLQRGVALAALLVSNNSSSSSHLPVPGQQPCCSMHPLCLVHLAASLVVLQARAAVATAPKRILGGMCSWLIRFGHLPRQMMQGLWGLRTCRRLQQLLQLLLLGAVGRLRPAAA
jgi:hypothetical protein